MSERQLDLFDFEDDWSIILTKEFPAAEYREIEYKSAQGGFSSEFWKTYSAFANTNNGIIVLGIVEKKGSIRIEGLTEGQIEKYKKDFRNNCNNPNTVSRNLLVNKDVKVITFKDKKILAFRIPFAGRTERPVFLTRNPFRNTYKRNHY
jgi:predicted HTH transcriptional regulator